MKKERGGSGVEDGASHCRAQANCRQGSASSPLPPGGMEAAAGGRASLEKARRGFTGPSITGEHAGSESGQPLESFPPLR